MLVIKSMKLFGLAVAFMVAKLLNVDPPVAMILIAIVYFSQEMLEERWLSKRLLRVRLREVLTNEQHNLLLAQSPGENDRIIKGVMDLLPNLPRPRASTGIPLAVAEVAAANEFLTDLIVFCDSKKTEQPDRYATK